RFCAELARGARARTRRDGQATGSSDPPEEKSMAAGTGTVRLTAILLVLSIFAPARLQARSITVRPGGTGDAPTLQAGIDSLFSPFGDGIQERCALAPDTVIVAPGFYPETLQLHFTDQYLCRRSVVVCPEGPTRTRVLGFKFNEACIDYGQCE